MKYLEKIQSLLPLGYLYLIILGLLKESILFHHIGINILKYSSITDILISPISDMVSNPRLIIVIISFCIFFFFVQFLLVENRHKNWAQKILGRNRFNENTSKKEIQKAIFPFFVLIIAVELLAVFVGVGVGKGDRLSKAIVQNDFSCNYKVNFSSGKSEDLYVFDLNSSYYFYVAKGSKHIKIAPVGTISSLELINSEKP
jgi:hypothetical protein